MYHINEYGVFVKLSICKHQYILTGYRRIHVVCASGPMKVVLLRLDAFMHFG